MKVLFQSGLLINIGPVNVPITIVGMSVSLLVWYYIIRYQEAKIKPSMVDKERLSDNLLTLIMIGIVLFKFWPIFTSPSLIWTRGWSVIYFSGGRYYQFGLALLIIGWFIWYFRKYSLSLHKAGQMLVRGFIPALIVWYILIREYGVMSDLLIGYDYQGQLYHPINLYMGAFLIGMAVLMLFLQRRQYPIEPWLLLLISFFYIILDPIRAMKNVFIFFNGLQWAWIMMVISVFWIIYSHRRVDQQGTQD